MDAPHGVPLGGHDERPREPAADKAPASKVLVFGCFCDPYREVMTLLEEQGFDVVPCRSSQALLEEVVQHAPGVVVFGLRPDSTEDLGVLHLVRRVSPDAPLILLATEGSLNVQRLVQSSRPIYYAVCPIEPVELREAVRAALARRRTGRASPRGC